MNPLDWVKDKVTNEVDGVINREKMKMDSINTLKVIRGDGREVNYDATTSFPIDDLKDLGISNYESLIKMIDLENSTLGKYGDMLGIDTSKLTGAMNNVVSVVDSAIGAYSYVSGLFMNEVFKRNLGAIPPSSRDDSIGKKDPISNDVDLKERVYNIVERCGYAQDKTLSVGYSREYIFTSRPLLASDSSGHYKSFAFPIRPNLNLVERNDEGMLRLVPALANYDSMFSLINSDPKLFSELCRDGCNKSNLWMLLSNYIKEIPPIRLAETERSGIENKYGYSTPMAGVPEYHNVDVSITFNDNYRGDIAKLLYAMSEYRHNTSKRGYAKRPEYIQNKADDTLISMYIVTVTPDMEVVGFGVLLNGVIGDTPTHFTQHKAEGFSKDELLDNFTVSVKFSTYYPHCPKYYDYFNNIMNFNPLDCVDLKGSNYNMVAPGRHYDFETSGNSSRAPLFGMDFGIKIDKAIGKANGIIDTAQGYVDQYGKYVDKARGLLTYADSFNAVKNLLDQGKVGSSSADIVESIKYQHKGQFEFLAKRPGIYTAASTNPLEKGRVIYRLGFSY